MCVCGKRYAGPTLQWVGMGGDECVCGWVGGWVSVCVHSCCLHVIMKEKELVNCVWIGTETANFVQSWIYRSIQKKFFLHFFLLFTTLRI